VSAAPLLSVLDLSIAAALMLLNAAVSFAFRLGIERRLLVTALRMVVQLALVGLLLRVVFAEEHPALTLVLVLAMTVVAGYEVVARQSRRIRGLAPFVTSTGTLLFVGTLFAGIAVGGLVRPEPWHAPRFLLPVLGMVLGNAMTGVSLVLETFAVAAERERNAIEARLALGATRHEALSGVLAQSLTTGLMPILNAMAVAGVVSLPGMMTGQILAGSDPLEAAKYQMLILFVISGATAASVLATGLAAVRLLTDDRHRLRLDRLAAANRQPQV